MKEIFRHSSPGLVGMYQSVLEAQGIPTFVRNTDTQQSLVGGLATAIVPLPDFWPTLCVMNDEDYPVAMAVLKEGEREEETGRKEWTCGKCGESVPAAFAECWNCGNPGEP